MVQGDSRGAGARQRPADEIPAHEERLLAIYAIQRLLTQAPDESTIVRESCAILASHRQYRLVWLGYARPDGGIDVAGSSGEIGYLQGFNVRWDESPLGSGPVGRAIRRKTACLMRVSEAAFAPWRDRARSFGIQSSIALPFSAGEGRSGVLVAYASDSGAQLQRELMLLSGLAEDIGRALVAARTRVHLASETAEVLRRELIIEHVKEGIVTADHHGAIDSFNPAAESMFGYDRGEVVGSPLSILMPVKYRERHRAGFQRYLETGESRMVDKGPMEFEGLRKDGTTFPLELAVSRMEVGGRIQFIGILRDITERKRTADALHESEGRLNMIADQLPAITWTTDRDLRLTSAFGAGLPLLQPPGTQMVGMTLMEYVGSTDPKFKAIAAHRAALDGESTSYAVDWRGHWFQTHVEPLRDANGAIIGALGLAFDVTDRHRAEELLRRQLDYTTAMAGGLAEGLMAVDLDCRISYVNPAALRILGWEAEEVVGRIIYDVVDADPLSPPPTAENSPLQAALVSGKTVEVDALTLVRKDGSTLQCAGGVSPILSEGKITGAVATFRDVTEAIRLREQLAVEAEKARRRRERLDALWRIVVRRDTGHDSQIEALLAEGARALDCPRASVSLIDGDEQVFDVAAYGEARMSVGERMPLSGSVAKVLLVSGETMAWKDILLDPRLQRAENAMRLGVRAYIGTAFAVGEQRRILVFSSTEPREADFDSEDKTYVELLAAYFSRLLRQRQQDAQIVYLAYHDPLTGLPNRAWLMDRLVELVAQSTRGERRFAVLMIDLDHFKDVNDSLGHAAGDSVLAEAGRRISAALRAGDLLARLSGDEFCIVLLEPGTAPDIEGLANRVCATLAKPFAVDGSDFYLSASIGIAVFPVDGESPAVLLPRADGAMYRAKLEGRNRSRFHSEELVSDLARRRSVRDGLRTAVERKEMELHYQPQVDMHDRTLVGAEALLRWRRGGTITMPNDFIPIAEESGLMIPLGEWVLRQACTQAREWLGQGYNPTIAINISAKQFQDPTLSSTMRSILKETGADPTRIEIEITESVAMRDPAAAEKVLAEWKRIGLRVALDDFGTFYSSLAYLKKLPVDIIKIDKSFVDGLPSDHDDAAITRAIIALARSLDREVIAEGVETEEQRAWLMAEGCRLGQGYLFGKPMAAQGFLAAVARTQTHDP